MPGSLALLLIEDVERDADLLVLTLEQSGYQVAFQRVDTADALVSALEERAWDLVVSDYSMPGFGGLDALALVRQHDPDIPFLLVSGTVGEDSAVAAMKAGANDYLMKGRLERLAPAIERELRDAEHRRQRRAAELALRQSEEWFRAMFDQAAVGVAQSDLEGRWIRANRHLLDLYGYSWNELSQLRYHDITHPDDLEADLAQFDRLRAGDIPSYTVEKRFIRKDGRLVWAHVTVSLIHDAKGESAYSLAIVKDISDWKQAEDTLRFQALHDVLTGLPNRTLLQDRLEQAIHRAEREGTPVALLLLDLDRFKEINDTFGHHAGDIVLCELASRLEQLVRRSDTVSRPRVENPNAAVARLGGDEFALLLPDTDLTGAKVVADRVITEISRPCRVEGQELDIGVSLGIALYPDHGTSSEQLLQHADVAMYRAKHDRVGFSIYEAAHDPYTRGRITLIGDLRRAIEQDELQVYYQPKVDLGTGVVVGAEALVRWDHQVEGMVPATRVIGLAEHTGMISALTVWMMRAAARRCRAWNDAGYDLSVAVNVSARSLHDHHLVDVIRDVLRESGLSPSSLVMEITETAVMIDPQRAATILGQLRALGVRASIDDFGTGYSSLSYLKELPVNELKIDRSFVQHLTAGSGEARIVRAAINLAHDLELQAVAEGVETDSVWNQLGVLGCDLGQGYAFGRPIPGDDFEARIVQKLVATSLRS